MQGQTLGSHGDSIHYPKIHQKLRKLVQTLGWTYAVIWKPTHDNRVLGWYGSWFNNRGTEEGKALELQFESVFRCCQFMQAKPGYAFRAWQARTGTWWTRHMNRLPTNIHKELFLQQASIQTIICLPIHAPDGTTCCVELATNVLEPESRELQGSIQAFLNESVAPYISIGHLPASSFLQQEVNVMGGMGTQAGSSTNSADDLIQLPHRSSSSSAQGIIAAMEVQGTASNPSTSSYTQVMQELEEEEEAEEEPFGGYGVISRGEQDYLSWTLPGSNYASAALTKEYTGFVDPPSNSAGDQNLDVAVFKEYTQMATNHVPNPVVNWSPHQSSSSLTLGQVDQIFSAFNTPPSSTLDCNPHLMRNQGRPPAGLDSISTQIQWDLDVELAGQFEAPSGNLVPQPRGGHNLVGISQMQLNPPADHAELVNLYNLGRMGTNAQPQSFQASGSTILSSHLPSTSVRRNHHSLQFRHDSARSPFRSLAQIDRMQSRLQQQLSSSTSSTSASQSSRLQGRPPCTVDVHAKPKSHLIQTWVRNWQDKRWQQEQQQELDKAEFAGEDIRSPQTIARDEHQAVKHMRAERVRRKIFNCRLQTLKSLVPIIHKKKDKVTVLSSTIDYIRHLTSSLESNKAARLSEQQLLPADRPSTNTITAQLPEDFAGAGASSSITTTGPVIVEVEVTGNGPGSSTTSTTSLVIRVEAQNHSRSLIHLLNVLHDGFGLQLTNLDYGCVNDRFHATITIENPGNQNASSTGCVQLREALQRELAASPNGTPSTDSDLS